MAEAPRNADTTPDSPIVSVYASTTTPMTRPIVSAYRKNRPSATSDGIRVIRIPIANTRAIWPMSRGSHSSTTRCWSVGFAQRNAAAAADSSTPRNIHTKLAVRNPSRGAVPTRTSSLRVLGTTVVPDPVAWPLDGWARFSGS